MPLSLSPPKNGVKAGCGLPGCFDFSRSPQIYWVFFLFRRKLLRRRQMPRHQRVLKTPITQGLDKSILSLLVLGLLLVCLPTWAQEEEEEEFKGVGIHIKLRGAWVRFLGGDIDKGTAGMYDRQVAEIASAGFELGRNDKNSFHNGYELTGDIVYYFTPRIGLGVGGSLIRAHQESWLLFHWPSSPYDYRLMGLPEIKILSFRLGLFYRYGGNVTTPYSASSLTHRTDARQLGIHGGLGLEIRMNRRLAFIIEALGRYAKISGFKGKEETYEWSGYSSSTVEEHGTLFFIEGEGYPRLDIPPAGASGDQGAREAVLNFSGFSLRAGLNFKF
jgi:hypothetical protein